MTTEHRLRVHTARMSYRGADRLDVTRKSAGPDGLPFAPSWSILRPMIARRAADGPVGVAYAWPHYVADYTAEMRRSYREQRAAWDTLLARDEVTLVCYCADPAFCHRARGWSRGGSRSGCFRWRCAVLRGIGRGVLDVSRVRTIVRA